MPAPACVDRLVPSGRGGRRLTSCHSDLCFTRTAPDGRLLTGVDRLYQSVAATALRCTGVSDRSVQTKPVSRVGRDEEQNVTIRFRVRRFVCRSAKKLIGELADHQSPDLAVAKR